MLLFSLRTLAQRRGRRLAPEAIAAIQRRRLISTVRHAIRYSPFYREKYRHIDPRRFAVADLPPTSKPELMAQFDRVVTDPAVTRAGLEAFLDDPGNCARLFRGRYVASHTSGSQGQRLLIVQDRRAVELFFGLQMTRGNTERASPVQAVRRFLRPTRMAVVTMKQGFYPSAALFQHMPSAARRFVDILWLSYLDRDVIERLNAFRPEVLTAYAGVLELLALEAAAGRLRLGATLRQVVNHSEALTDRARARIEEAFGRHVMNNYATGECPFLSNGCPTDAEAHVNADWAILEVVDAAYRPVPPGTAGSKVLITNLANRVMPFLRYEVGDVVTMAAAPCRCGSRLPRIERIQGRADEVFQIGAPPNQRMFSNLILTHAFEYVSDLRDWQAIQRGPSRVLIRLEPLPGAALDLPRVRQILRRELEAYGYGDIDVDLQVVPRLNVDPRSGKFRRMVSLGAAGPDLDPVGALGPIGPVPGVRPVR